MTEILDLSDPIKRDDRIKVTDRDVRRWLRTNRIKATKPNVAKYRDAVRRDKLRKQGPRGVEASGTTSVEPWLVAYGYARVTPTPTFFHTSSGHVWAYQVLTLAAHRIHGAARLFLDKTEIALAGSGWATGPTEAERDFANRVLFKADRLGDPDQTVQPDLHALLPTYWTADHRQRGRAHALLACKYDSLAFPTGLPQAEVELWGKIVYDPRIDTWAVSSNAALVIADLLTDTVIGYGYPWSMINVDSLSAAADVCDEDVPLRAGGTEKRYAVDGWFTTSESLDSVLARFEAAMAGRVEWSNGKWIFLPGVWREPVSLELNEDDLRSDLRIRTLPGSREIYNSIRGRYRAKDKGFEETDFPAQKITDYITEDGGEVVFEDFDLLFSSSASRCQRCARIELERTRRFIEFEAAFSLRAYPLEVGDVVPVTLSRYGWSGKLFEVLDYEFGPTDDLEPLVTLRLKETDPGVYAWTPGLDEQQTAQAPATGLPLPYSVPAVTGLVLSSGTGELYLRTDGTVATRLRATWSAVADAFVIDGGRVELQYKRNADADWLPALFVSGDAVTAILTDVRDGEYYDVRARAINAIGVAGPWAQVLRHYVAGKSVPPSNVPSVSAVLTPHGVSVSWAGIGDVDLAAYELSYALDGGASQVLTTTRGTSFQRDALPAGTLVFSVVAIDTSGNRSGTPATATLIVYATSIGAASGTLDGPDIVLAWTPGAGSYPVREYEVRVGASWGTGATLVRTKATSYRLRADFSGLSRTYWVAAEDAAGNLGTPTGIVVTIEPLAAPTGIVPDVIDNNVLLRWTAPALTAANLPIAWYRILRGADLGTATLIGTVSGTFANTFESAGGLYTYRVQPVDTAGGVGAAGSIAVDVRPPPDLIVRLRETLTAGTCINTIEMSPGVIIGAVDTAETWEEHFDSRGWNTPQDQCDADAEYETYAAPWAASGTWYDTLDAGAIIPNVTARLSFSVEVLAGTPTVEARISYSDDLITWTDGPAGELSIFVSSGRYYAVLLTFTGGIAIVRDAQLVLDAKKITADGYVETSATLPTTVTVPGFVAFESILITPVSSDPVTWGVDDSAEPVSFDVYAWNTSGTQVARGVYWKVTGY